MNLIRLLPLLLVVPAVGCDGSKHSKADIERGLADVEAGRVREFDAGRIVERGRRLLAGRSPSG